MTSTQIHDFKVYTQRNTDLVIENQTIVLQRDILVDSLCEDNSNFYILSPQILQYIIENGMFLEIKGDEYGQHHLTFSYLLRTNIETLEYVCGLLEKHGLFSYNNDDPTSLINTSIGAAFESEDKRVWKWMIDKCNPTVYDLILFVRTLLFTSIDDNCLDGLILLFKYTKIAEKLHEMSNYLLINDWTMACVENNNRKMLRHILETFKEAKIEADINKPIMISILNLKYEFVELFFEYFPSVVLNNVDRYAINFWGIEHTIEGYMYFHQLFIDGRIEINNTIYIEVLIELCLIREKSCAMYLIAAFPEALLDTDFTEQCQNDPICLNCINEIRKDNDDLMKEIL